MRTHICWQELSHFCPIAHRFSELRDRQKIVTYNSSFAAGEACAWGDSEPDGAEVGAQPMQANNGEGGRQDEQPGMRRCSDVLSHSFGWWWLLVVISKWSICCPF